MMYSIISAISVIIRLFVLPNPFATVKYGSIINVIIEPILYKLTYSIVGIYYSKNSNPVFGSILYFIFYMIHVGILHLFVAFDWNMIIITIVIAVYVSILTLLSKLKYGIS